jgi:hypothetical protein
MIINPFEITNLILDKKDSIKVEDENWSAWLSVVDEKSTNSVVWGSKLTIKDNKPFNISHPIFRNHTFKLTCLNKKKQQASLIEVILNRFSKS